MARAEDKLERAMRRAAEIRSRSVPASGNSFVQSGGGQQTKFQTGNGTIDDVSDIKPLGNGSARPRGGRGKGKGKGKGKGGSAFQYDPSIKPEGKPRGGQGRPSQIGGQVSSLGTPIDLTSGGGPQGRPPAAQGGGGGGQAPAPKPGGAGGVIGGNMGGSLSEPIAAPVPKPSGVGGVLQPMPGWEGNGGSLLPPPMPPPPPPQFTNQQVRQALMPGGAINDGSVFDTSQLDPALRSQVLSQAPAASRDIYQNYLAGVTDPSVLRSDRMRADWQALQPAPAPQPAAPPPDDGGGEADFAPNLPPPPALPPPPQAPGGGGFSAAIPGGGFGGVQQGPQDPGGMTPPALPPPMPAPPPGMLGPVNMIGEGGEGPYAPGGGNSFGGGGLPGRPPSPGFGPSSGPVNIATEPGGRTGPPAFTRPHPGYGGTNKVGRNVAQLQAGGVDPELLKQRQARFQARRANRMPQ